MSGKLVTRLILGAAALLLVLRYAGHVEWAARGSVGLLIATLIVRWGYASMGPLRVGSKTYREPVDVVEHEGVPVYSCPACGTQLVLLRRGSDAAPRHCGEAMTYEVVPDYLA